MYITIWCFCFNSPHIFFSLFAFGGQVTFSIKTMGSSNDTGKQYPVVGS